MLIFLCKLGVSVRGKLWCNDPDKENTKRGGGEGIFV